jgi:hypothetical protein
MFTLITIAVGLFIGFWIAMFILPLIPGAIDALSNKPNLHKVGGPEEISYPKSQFGFFTFLQPGRVKIIERGERFIRCIMAYDGHMFKGERTDNDLQPEHAEYWEVVTTTDGHQDSDPLPPPWGKRIMTNLDFLNPIGILFWAWKRWVYSLTGGVFTGIPPFQNARTYPIERFKAQTAADGQVTLKRIHDYSDHYRVADFQYPFISYSADSQDKIPFNITLNEVARVSNPYMLAYNTDDDWTTRLAASLGNSVTTFTRSHSANEVYSAKSAGAAATELATTVTTMTQEAVNEIGLLLKRTEIRDISAVNREHADRLAEEAFAKVKRAADEELAKGKAAYIREEGAALTEHPHAEIVVQTEGLVRAAEAAGRNGGVVILGGQSTMVDPMQAAILKTLKDIRGPGGIRR